MEGAANLGVKKEGEKNMITKNVSILWGWEKTHNTYAGRYQGWKNLQRQMKL